MLVLRSIFGIIGAVLIIAVMVGIIALVVDLLNKSEHRARGPYEKFIKRPLDAFLATGALIVFLPVLLITAVLVRIKLGSPVLFKQNRPGKDEKIFKLVKFRTMTDARDEKGKLLPDTVRLTKFGRLLRSTSIDELPELINIIKGDMSIIGPRPLAVSYLPYYNNKEKHRHDVRPGLTGLAQVNGRNSISWDAKFKYDVEYIENITFINDMKILFLTVKKVFVREGIGQGEQHPGNLYDVRTDWLDENGKIKPEYQENKA